LRADWKASLSPGCDHTVVLTQEDSVICWGDKSYEQNVVPGALKNVFAVMTGFGYVAALTEHEVLSSGVVRAVVYCLQPRH
jgi:alpha-tubulin suppressor-like RCC1 family protein